MKAYYDLVFEGSRDVILGFVVGFIKGSKLEDEAVIIPDNHLEKQAGLGYLLKAVNLKGGETHLIAEQELSKAFSEVVSADKRKVPLKIISYTQIKYAVFEFTVNAFSRKIAHEIEHIISDTPKGVKVTFEKKEEIIRAGAKSIVGYAPEHKYEYHTSGNVSGNPAHTYKLYEKLKLYELIKLSLFRLEFEESVLLQEAQLTS